MSSEKANEAARIKLTDTISATVEDPHNIQPIFADLVSELNVFGGVVHLSLASLTIDGEGDSVSRRAIVGARLRIPLTTLRFIQDTLERVEKMKDAPPAPSQSLN